MAPFDIPYPEARRVSTDSLQPPPLTAVSRCSSFDGDVSLASSCATTTATQSPSYSHINNNHNNVTVVSPQYSLQRPPSPVADSPAAPESASAKLQRYNRRHSHNRISSSDARIAPTSPITTDAIHPNKFKMKKQRRSMTAVGMVTGGVIGTSGKRVHS